jgi:hypothetical protein
LPLGVDAVRQVDRFRLRVDRPVRCKLRTLPSFASLWG